MTITSAVKDIITNDLTASSAAEAGLLNLSSYARSIQPRIEKTLYKPVQLRSIVVSLSRIVKDLEDKKKHGPLILSEISIKTDLALFTVPKSSATMKKIGDIGVKAITDEKYFNTTVGTYEISVIGTRKLMKHALEELDSKPLHTKKNLVGVSIKLTKELSNRPGTIHDILSRLKVKNIDLEEIVSTSTEVTIVIEKQYLSAVLEQFGSDL